MLACNGVLVLTAFGLYYAGSDALRRWTSALHVAIGLGLPLLVAGHVVLGRRARQAAARKRLATLRQGL
jgi:hypothetical protein